MWLSNDLNYKVAGGDQYLLSVRLHQLIAQQPTVQCSVQFTVGCTTAFVVLVLVLSSLVNMAGIKMIILLFQMSHNQA